ncbi:MAG: hypothetical protein IKF52_04055 [Clostridia bacterium]|nr:hypothetical protein [Clostridia bacterium]
MSEKNEEKKDVEISNDEKIKKFSKETNSKIKENGEKTKKKIEISLKKIFILIAIIILIIVIITFIILRNKKDYKMVFIKGEIYYQRLNDNTWNGEYHIDHLTSRDYLRIKSKVVSYNNYLETIDSVNSVIPGDQIKPYYSDKDSNYIILAYTNGFSNCTIDLIDCIEKKNKIIIYADSDECGDLGAGEGYFIAIPTDMPIDTEIEFRHCYSKSEIDEIRNPDKESDKKYRDDKPIIYLYPKEKTEVSVKLLEDEQIVCSYPKYRDEWKVLADSDGTLMDLNTNRELYSLYYESDNIIDFKVEKDGFIVKGEDTIEFLEEKLSILGLTEKEAEEFIVYWLPRLENNKYNYIRFATKEEINSNMPLEINPNPDTTIRILMTFKGLDNPINVQEQNLEMPNREGFVAVEWGGTEIK